MEKRNRHRKDQERIVEQEATKTPFQKMLEERAKRLEMIVRLKNTYFIQKFTFPNFHKIHIIKIPISKNSHYQNLIFHKIHIFKMSFFTKFTFSKCHFSQNSQFQNLNFHKIHIFKHRIRGNFKIKTGVVPQCVKVSFCVRILDFEKRFLLFQESSEGGHSSEDSGHCSPEPESEFLKVHALLRGKNSGGSSS